MDKYESKLQQIENAVRKSNDKYKGKIDSIEAELKNYRNLFATNPLANLEGMSNSKSQMNGYIRKGIMDPDEVKSFSSDAGEAGVVVQPSMHNKILSFMKAKSPMRSLASIQSISTNAIDYVLEDGEMAAGWVGEKDARPETNTSKLVTKRIEVHELYAQPKATQKLIDDAEIDVESWLSERLADRFASAENAAFIRGDGDKKPSGILRCEDIAKIVIEGLISADNLLQMLSGLPQQYHADASFIMNQKTLAIIQSLKDKEGRFIWQHSMSDKLNQTIFGVPVVCVPEMPDIANDSLSIALGDFKSAYKIIDRAQIGMMRDPYTEKPYVKFYAVKRVGGAVLNPDAVRLAQFRIDG